MAGPRREAQQMLGVLNATCMARRFVAAGFDVVIADVLTPGTAVVYRNELWGCVIVHLVTTLEEAQRRSGTRPDWLTVVEFRLLHDMERRFPPSGDHRLDVTSMSRTEQLAAPESLRAAT